MSLIQLKDVYKIYAEGQENQVNALDGVTLSIDQGEFVAIIGTSGSGKSTMMNILGCLDVPTRGEYLLDGTPIRERTQRELSQIRSRQIAFIFQGYNLIPSLNVWQNVALPMLYQRVPLAERRARAMEALEKVEIAAKADNRPAQLSGGQQQRVAVARAIAARSPILMADEPTGALDSRTGEQVLGLMRQMNAEGTTVILITHDNGIAAQADRTVRVKDGRIVHDSLWDGVLAGGVAVFICWMERWLAPFCLNGVAFQFIASFLSGMAALLCCRVCPLLHADMVLIGVIMLLVPGIPFTNAIRDILLGDIISGSLRLVEAVLLAAMLALGMMAAIWLMGGAA